MAAGKLVRKTNGGAKGQNVGRAFYSGKKTGKKKWFEKAQPPCREQIDPEGVIESHIGAPPE